MLLGRDAERARLAELLAGAHAGASAALVIRGEPGIGKSALLDDAVAAADGMTVLRARGVESESELSFAGLADLLGPVTSELGSLPPPQRAALAGALALGPPVPGDRFTLYAATLSLLAAVGERAPVLVAVDDAPWLDAPSREALVFVARRLQEEGVVLLLTARTGEPVGSETGRRRRARARRARRRRVGGAAGAGRRDRPRGRRPAVRRHRRQPARAARAVGPAERRPAQRRSSRSRSRCRSARASSAPSATGSTRCPRPTRRALAVAAASESGALDELAAAGVDLGALEPAEAAGLIAVAEGRLSFRHSLLRSVAYRAVPAPEQRAAHRALAEAVEGERRAWHLAAAAVAPDEEVAAALAEAAGAARARGGPAAAMRAAERAARLTPDPAAAGAGRLLEAAGDFARVGRPDRAQELLGEALELAGDPRLRADVQHLRALIEARSGAARRPPSCSGAEAARIEPVDPVRAAMMTHGRRAAAVRGGRERAPGSRPPGAGTRCAERAGAAADAGRPAAGDGAAALQRAADRAADARRRRGVARRGRRPVGARTGPDLRHRPGASCGWRTTTRARRLLEGAHRAVPRVERSRPDAVRAALPLRARVPRRPLGARVRGREPRRCGSPRRPGSSTTRATRWPCSRASRPRSATSRSAARTWPVAGDRRPARGRDRARLRRRVRSGCSSSGSAAARRPSSRSSSSPASSASGRRATRRCCSGRPTSSRPTCGSAAATRPRRSSPRSSAPPTTRAAAGRPRRPLAAAACSRPTTRSTSRFAEALEHREMPFETARTRLALGERLRRAGRRVEARAELREALAAFERLGAQPWAERARTELRASGERVRRGSPTATEQLTPQELQVALRGRAAAPPTARPPPRSS